VSGENGVMAFSRSSVFQPSWRQYSMVNNQPGERLIMKWRKASSLKDDASVISERKKASGRK